MQIKENCIILRHFSSSDCKVAALTQTMGKIILVALNDRQIQRMHNGSVVTATLVHKHQALYRATDLEIVSTPLPTIPDDIYWLHHLLELSYFFLPLHDQATKHFFILSSCLIFIRNHIHHYDGWHSLKFFCIAMFLMHIGFNPPEHLERSLRTFSDTLFSFIDFDEKQKIECLSSQLENFPSIFLSELKTWLITCIQSHPRIQMFKTLGFMYQSSLPRIQKSS